MESSQVCPNSARELCIYSLPADHIQSHWKNEGERSHVLSWVFCLITLFSTLPANRPCKTSKKQEGTLAFGSLFGTHWHRFGCHWLHFSSLGRLFWRPGATKRPTGAQKEHRSTPKDHQPWFYLAVSLPRAVKRSPNVNPFRSTCPSCCDFLEQCMETSIYVIPGKPKCVYFRRSQCVWSIANTVRNWDFRFFHKAASESHFGAVLGSILGVFGSRILLAACLLGVFLKHGISNIFWGSSLDYLPPPLWDGPAGLPEGAKEDKPKTPSCRL